MAKDKPSKKDELKVMKLIEDGKNKVNDLVDSLDWTRERVEKTVDELQHHEYVQKVQKGGDQVLELTERGREEVPKLVKEVVEDTREFVDSLGDTFHKHMSRVLPEITIDIKAKMPKKKKED